MAAQNWTKLDQAESKVGKIDSSGRTRTYNPSWVNSFCCPSLYSHAFVMITSLHVGGA
jgi:hypothetical protein